MKLCIYVIQTVLYHMTPIQAIIFHRNYNMSKPKQFTAIGRQKMCSENEHINVQFTAQIWRADVL